MSVLGGVLAAVGVLAPNAARAQPACTPLLPEAVKDVVEHALPTDATRWSAIRRIWGEVEDTVRADVREMLQAGGLYPASDTLQGRTHDLFREALFRRDFSLASDLTALWRLPYETISYRSSVMAWYVSPSKAKSAVVFDRPHPMWVGADGIETILYSAIFLAGATDIVRTVAGIPPGSRPQALSAFATQTVEIALDHYRRWAFGPGIWQVRGWGCDAGGLDLVEFTTRRLDGSLGNGYRPYCRAPTDIDMLIAIGVVNLLAASSIDRELVAIDDAAREQLLELARLQARFLASRFVLAQPSGSPQAGAADFDPGVWALHSEMAYAGYVGSDFPGRAPAPQPGVGWDFSHGARIAWMLLTFADEGRRVGIDLDWNSLADAFARQVASRVLDDKSTVPRFRNYLDGSNGWYRVNFAGRKGSGTPPFGLSRAYLAMPWARLSTRDPRLMEAARGAWRMLTGATLLDCANLDETYVAGSYWKDGRPLSRPLSGINSVELIPFLSVAPVR